MNARPLRERAFRRDRLTLTLDGSFVTWGWFLYAFTPIVPQIADEQGISFGLAGLHGTAMAVGSVVSGSITPTLAGRFGRRVQHLVGTVLIVVGVVALISGSVLAATLPAVFVLALGGNLTITAAQPALVVHHGPAGPSAVTEANGLGSGIGILAPLAVGLTIGAGWGWRPAVAATVLLAVGVGIATASLRGEPSLERPAPVAHADRPAETRFPPELWFFWLSMLCGSAIEFSTTFWAADVLETRTGASAALATAAVTGLIAGMTASRFVLGPLAARKAPEKLLLVGYAVALVGWAVFWTATTPTLAVVGLVVAGLGYGPHYPLSVALVLRAAGARPDKAQGVASVGVGIAVGGAPFALGALADAVGTHSAFLVVAGLIVVGGGAVLLGLRSVRARVRATAAERLA
jgi:MFS family permease